MQAELTLSLSTMYGFLLVVTRLAGAFAFVPIPGAESDSPLPKVVLTLGAALALMPHWPAVDGSSVTPSLMAAWIASEAAIGLTVGVAVSLLTQALMVAAQVISLQAGFAYASTIDPATQADTGILLVFARLLAGLLFFALGLDRQVLQALGASLEAYPPGAFALTRSISEEILRLASGIFSVGIRLALPIVALLAMVDLALAALGRINSHVQVLTLAFPVKMTVTIAALGIILYSAPQVYQGYASHVMATVRQIVTR